MFYVVDRIEGGIAVIIGDDGTTFDVPRGHLPRGAREGSVLRVKEGKGQPDWSTAVLDDAERKRRLKETKEMMDKLREGDPGGDITIS